MLAATTAIARRTHSCVQRRIAIWLGLLLGYLLVAAAMAWLDCRTGALGKFYLFRPAALVLLLWLLFIAAEARWWTFRAAVVLRLVLLSVLLPSFLIGSIENIRVQIARRNEAEHAKSPLFEAIANLTTRQDVVLIHSTLEYTYNDFERRTGRATLVNWKFENTEGSGHCRSGGCSSERRCSIEGAAERSSGESTSSVASERMDQLADSCGPVVYRDRNVVLIRVRDLPARCRTDR